MSAPIYDTITREILAAIDADGLPPWVMPWKSDSRGFVMPINGHTGRAYNGINVLWLMMNARKRGWSSQEYWTPVQVAKVGGAIQAGSAGVPVILIRPAPAVTKEDLERRKKRKDKKTPKDQADASEAQEDTDKPKGGGVIVRSYVVFNRAQCTGLPDPRRAAPVLGEAPAGIPRAEAIITGNRHLPPITWGGDRAYFIPAHDRITMPDRARFQEAAEMYSTLFHESIHSTGHPARLNRSDLADAGRFGDENYSREELTAEMGAAFLCGIAGIDNIQARMNSVAYLRHWRDRLAKDSRLIVQAAAKAQAATDYILAGVDAAALPTLTAEEADNEAGEVQPPLPDDPAAPALAEAMRATLGQTVELQGRMDTQRWVGDEGMTYGYQKRINAAPWVDVAKSQGIRPSDLDKMADRLEQGKPLGKSRAARWVQRNADLIMQEAADRFVAEGYAPVGERASEAESAEAYAMMVNPSKFPTTTNTRPNRQKSKVNPGPAGAVELVGLGRFLRCIVRLPNGSRAAIVPPGGPSLAWEPKRRRLAVLYPETPAAAPLSGSVASAHAHFHGATPSAGVVMLDPGPVGPGWQKVGLLESVTYDAGNIVSPARGNAPWKHDMGDHGERGRKTTTPDAASPYQDALLPELWVNEARHLSIKRRKGNTYTVRDWIIG